MAELEARFAEAVASLHVKDERSILDECWFGGILRTALLEVGVRLCRALPQAEGAKAAEAGEAGGEVSEAGRELGLYLVQEEVGLLLGGGGPQPVPVGRPRLAALVACARARRTHHRAYQPRDVPRALAGPKHPPVDEADGGSSAARDAIDGWDKAALDVRLATKDSGAEEASSGDGALPPTFLCRGMPCSAGSYTGRAVVVVDPGDAAKLRQGDVAIVMWTTAAFTTVAPLLGALVTEFGGVCSHGAMLAREFGMVAVVGARDATAKVKDGSLVVVDGDSGVVCAADGPPEST